LGALLHGLSFLGKPTGDQGIPDLWAGPNQLGNHPGFYPENGSIG
jgi:hypothetical protein